MSNCGPSSPEIAVDQGVFKVAECLGCVVSNDRVNGEYRRLILNVEGAALRARAGQFFQILCPSCGSEHPFLRRPMSIYGVDPERHQVEFLYKVTGGGTRGLAGLVSGACLPIFGPLGSGFHLDPFWNNVVIVGRGVGLATLAPLAEFAALRRMVVTVLLSAKSQAHVLSVDRFLAAGARVITVVDTDGSSDPANVEKVVRALVAERRADAFFTCGSTRLMLLLQKIATECGVPGQVAIEQQMACGLGMCFSCVRPFKIGNRIVSKRVCWDGPVFDLQETCG